MKDRNGKIKKIVCEHIINNKKEYFIIILLFVIGIFLGVIFVNHMQEEQKNEVSGYFSNFIEKMKTIENLYRGFCLGYTIATCIYSIGLVKGIGFIIISLLLQNILFIPAILAISVSGFKLYKSIIKDKQRENIRNEILRHTIFSLIMAIVLIISSLIEIFFSTSCLKYFIKYF
jgi:hypothetical protein